MKKMTFIVMAIAITLSSCSKDEDAPVTSVDKIVGTWGNYKDIDLTDDSVITYDSSDVENQETYKADGSVKLLGGTLDGKWENIGSGNYKMTAFGLSFIFKVEFIGDTEMVLRMDTDEYYYKRIN